MRVEPIDWRGINTMHSRLLWCCVFDHNLEFDTTKFTNSCVWPGVQGGRIFCCGFHSSITNRPGPDGRTPDGRK